LAFFQSVKKAYPGIRAAGRRAQNQNMAAPNSGWLAIFHAGIFLSAAFTAFTSADWAGT
jgi:hypothetical protein